MDHANEFPVETMCKVFSVSTSGYYDWRKLRLRPKPVMQDIKEAIKDIFADSENTYGSPRIGIELRKLGYDVSDATVARRMKEMGLKVLTNKLFVVTTDSDHDHPIAENLLDQNFEANHPNEKWVSDITYFRVAQQWHYLTVIVDLFDRAVVGWAISDNMTAQDTVVAAFEMARRRHGVGQDITFHSDRGAQYACQKFRTMLKDAGIRQSMSRKGNCYDNAVAESFFKTIKRECIYKHAFRCSRTAFTTIFRYIEDWYNTRRIHTTIGNVAPLQLRLMKLNSKHAA